MKFPDKSLVRRIIPHGRVLSSLNITESLRKTFNDEVEKISVVSELNAETTFVLRGEHVKHIDVVDVLVRRQALNPQIIQMIHREVSEYAVFIIRYEEWAQLWCKDVSEQGNYYQSSWQPYMELEVEVDGYDLDQIYLNFLRQVSSDLKTNFSMEIAANPVEPTIAYTMKNTRDDLENRSENLKARISTLEEQLIESKDFGQTVNLSMKIKLLKEELVELEKSSGLAEETNNENHLFADPVEAIAHTEYINSMRFNIFRSRGHSYH
ncbi:DUF4391 domain-containing protein [Eubacteriaceae bacterium ES3]|nr:DUF4391 domain-containing protein [Eubacteriaceae bacterium ES3]